MHYNQIDLKHEIKDSLFSALVREKKWLRQVYLSLYPDDTSVREDEIEIIKLENVFINGIYNDLSFKVKDKLIIFIECQSTWAPNISFRLLSYFASSLSRLEKGYKKKQYQDSTIMLPCTRFYVLYTGRKRKLPTYLYTRFQAESDIAARAKVLAKDNTRGILNEICLFSLSYDTNVSKLGRTEDAIRATIEECLEKNILADFIREHEEEVEEIMRGMSQEERIKDFIDYSKREGIEKGIEKEARRTIGKINSLDIPADLKKEILDALKTR